MVDFASASKTGCHVVRPLGSKLNLVSASYGFQDGRMAE